MVDDVDDEEEGMQYESVLVENALNDHEDRIKEESDSTAKDLSDLPSDDSDEYEPNQSNRRHRGIRSSTYRGRGRKRGISFSSSTASSNKPIKKQRTEFDEDCISDHGRARPKRAGSKKGNGGCIDGDGIVRRPNHPEHVSDL